MFENTPFAYLMLFVQAEDDSLHNDMLFERFPIPEVLEIVDCFTIWVFG